MILLPFLDKQLSLLYKVLSAPNSWFLDSNGFGISTNIDTNRFQSNYFFFFVGKSYTKLDKNQKLLSKEESIK